MIDATLPRNNKSYDVVRLGYVLPAWVFRMAGNEDVSRVCIGTDGELQHPVSSCLWSSADKMARIVAPVHRNCVSNNHQKGGHE